MMTLRYFGLNNCTIKLLWSVELSRGKKIQHDRTEWRSGSGSTSIWSPDFWQRCKVRAAYPPVLVTGPLTPSWGQMQALLVRKSFYSLQHFRHRQDVTLGTFLRIALHLTNTCTSVIMTISTAPPEQRYVLCNEDYSSAYDQSKTNSEKPPIQCK